MNLNQDSYQKAKAQNYEKTAKTVKPKKTVKTIKPVTSAKPITSVKPIMPSKITKPITPIKTVKALKPSLKSSVQKKPNFIWPVKGPILRRFKQSLHVKGIDIGGTMGQSVRSTAKGTVVYSGRGLKGYGNLIIIKHEQDFLSAYAHNAKLMVKEGDRVARGQEIAKMGKTDAERVKLHFEIRYKGNPIDPLKYLP